MISVLFLSIFISL